jgi:hypothetical protein
MDALQSFVVARHDLRATRFIDEPLPQVADGELLLKVDRFAFTANNITYVMGSLEPGREGSGVVRTHVRAEQPQSRARSSRRKLRFVRDVIAR